MIRPSFRELFALRSVPGAAEEVEDRYAHIGRERFDHENGVSVVACSYEDDDLAFLLAALARSTVPLAPRIINNAPGKDSATALALRMGARVSEEPVKGQMNALRAGLRKVASTNPDAPILITDADCMPQRMWAETMLKKARLSRTVGGVAFGSVVIEHGPSFSADALRTAFALGGDMVRWACQTMPRARGPNCLLQPDMDDRVISELETLPEDAFPCDVALRDSVIATGGVVDLVMDPRAFVFTRGDRFDSVRALARDLAQGGLSETGVGRIQRYSQ